MELRAEVRIAVDKPVKMTLLSHPDRQMDGVVADVSGRGMRILLANAVPLNAAIRMDFDDALILGEVCRCAPHRGGFAIGIRLCHSLIGLDQLAKVRSRFLHDRLPVAVI